MASYLPVAALVRGLDVLAALNKLRDRATVGELHRETRINKATIVRMLETLAHAGFVHRDPDRSYYEVTGKTLLLCAGYDQHRAVGRIVAPILAEFRKQVAWPSDVAIFDRDAMLVVDTSREAEAHPMLLNRLPGYRAPMLATSLGLAYLAFSDAATRTDILHQQASDPAPWNELARDAAKCGRYLDSIRARGYAEMHPAYSRADYGNQLSAIGVPILRNGAAIAAMNVLFLKSAIPLEKAVDTLLPGLKKSADKIAAAIASSTI